MSQDLPIFSILPELLTQIKTHSNSILQAEPGAGKSTQVPLALLKAPWLKGQKIIMLEPRRLAAKSIAHFLAKQLNESVGQSIGYRVKNDHKISKTTRLEIITEGILIRQLQNDPELNGVGLIIFDEFHERSLQADLALTLCLDGQQALREDLKLLIMSATLDRLALSGFLDNAPHCFCEGRHFPVQTTFLKQPLKQHDGKPFYATLNQTLLTALNEHKTGDLLVFLPGQKEILTAIKTFKSNPKLPSELKHTLICLPLYGALKTSEQDKVMQPTQNNASRKIIFATNIAETSLTLPNISVVIDTGLKRQVRYDANIGLSRLETRRISKASAKQRQGRAGRIQAGHCYRLWTEQEHTTLEDFDTPEIQQADLSGLCLELSAWGETDYRNLNWFTPPPKAHIQQAQALLIKLALITEKLRPTEQTPQIIQLGIEPRLGKILIESLRLSEQVHLNLLPLACDIAAILSEPDFLNRNKIDSNLISRIEVCQMLHQQQPHPLKHHFGVQQVLKTSQQWLKKLKGSPTHYTFDELNTYTGILLAYGFFDRIAQKRQNSPLNYRLANGKGAHLHPQDPLQETPYLSIATLEGNRQDGQIYLAAPITLSDLKTYFKPHITTQIITHYQAETKTLKSEEQQLFEKLILSRKSLPKMPSKDFQACLKSALIETKLSLLPWTEKIRTWLQRVRWLAQFPSEHQIDFQKLSEKALIDHLEIWLMPYLNSVTQLSDLNKLALQDLLMAQLNYTSLQYIEQEAPSHYISPTGQNFKIQYEAHRPPFVSLPLQAVFGEIKSPMLAFKQAPLTFELLSPARRPLQITNDLNHFWQTSYLDIAKEMRGRYPKHRWPEDALNEKPGKSLKR